MDCFRRETIPAPSLPEGCHFDRPWNDALRHGPLNAQPKLAVRRPARSSSMHRSIMLHTASIVPTRMTRDVP